MITSKKKALLSLAAAGLIGTQVQAASVSGSLDLKVTMPEILVLYHFNEVQIILDEEHSPTAANDTDAHEVGEGNVTITGTMGAPLTAALSIPGADTHSTNQTLSVTLNDAWAVRSVSSANVTVAGSIQTATLTHSTENGSTIGVSAMSLSSGNSSGASVSLAPQWAVQKGSISFELDLSSAAHSGSYASAATTANGTDTFLLTLTGN